MKHIYSNSLNCMVVKEFIYKGKHYTWNDTDCLYYWNESDETWLEEIPDGAII